MLMKARTYVPTRKV